MSDMVMVKAENERLRRWMNDILSVSALPAIWAGGDITSIGNTLVDSLAAILDVELLLLRVDGRDGLPDITFVGPRGRNDSIAAAVTAELEANFGPFSRNWPIRGRIDCGPSSYGMICESLGLAGSLGVLAAASKLPTFPSEQDQVIVRLAANQAAVALDEIYRQRADNNAVATRELRKVVDAIPVMAWSTLPDGRADFFNAHFLTYLGVTAEQATGWGWAACLHPDDAGPLQNVWIQLLASGAAGETEARLRRWDGFYRWFLFRANPVFGDDGAIIRWYGTNTDIHDRKTIEEALRRNAALMTQAQRLTSTGSVWWRPATREAHWSDETYRVLSHDPLSSPSVGMILERCHPDDLPKVQEALDRVIQLGQNADIEHRLLMPDGTTKLLHFVLQNIGADPTDPEFIGAIADISERKHAEEKVRRSELLLREGQRISRTGTFSWKIETDEITFSDELNRIFGFETGRVVDFAGIGARVHEEDRALLAAKMADVRQGEDNHDYEIRLLVEDQVKHVRVVGRVFRHLDGTMECIGAVQDVSAQRLAELARDKLRSEMSQLARVMSLSTMAASIAHEVNQPLSGIMMNASTSLRMLSETPPDVDGALETARRTIRDGNRASDVIKRLRNLFRRGAPTVEQLDLNEAINEVLGLLANDLQREKITLIKELSGVHPHVIGDRIQLQQVIMNLLRNSIDATRHVGQPRKEIVIRSLFGNRNCQVSVEDSGVGLANVELERLFDAFHTTKQHGMGIGLSVSRSIIEAHGGQIWAEPNPAGGAIFGFSLPTERGVHHGLASELDT
ncbi:PAS domain S-box protein [Sinorhizobium meliloti]|nr:histidine kinase [Sinorhizobium meliloti]MQV66205.1 PAS domain-containing protein [Sinorhizobium meliloti]RVQ39308.1 PAS domain S-box protein [Sinorhizobium meliloti]